MIGYRFAIGYKNIAIFRIRPVLLRKSILKLISDPFARIDPQKQVGRSDVPLALTYQVLEPLDNHWLITNGANLSAK